MNHETHSTGHQESNTPASVPSTSENREPGAPFVAASTGPRTPEGKARSSQNALKHGLRASKPENAVPDEMRQAYEKLRAEFLAQYRPEGPTESAILDLVILATWQLRRIHELEIFAPLSLDLDGDPSSFGQHERLARYRASYERMLHTNLKQINEIQLQRLLCMAENAATIPDHLPPGILVKTLFDRKDTIHDWAEGAHRTYVARRKAELNRKDHQSSPSVRQ
ncbi:MAG: hypothetical protein IH602_22210 [Bryobacteraceae bacterium]|nr:hypothetical protein [Bryobacteraceae bacterium]